MTIDILLTIGGFLFGSGGVAYGIFYWRENKLLKKTEVKDMHYAAESKFIENIDKAMDVFTEALDFQKARTEEIESFHNSRFERISETLKIYKDQINDFQKDSSLNRQQIRKLSQRIQSLEKKIDEDKKLLCHNTLCKIRQIEAL